MMRGYSDTQQHDSFQQYNLNSAGLDEAEQNYFLKYATSGFSDANHTQKVTKKTQTKITTTDHGAFSKIKNTQNEVLRQLKQQYQILRNLPIDDKIGIKSKVKQRQPTSEYSSSIDDRSDITSSKQSRSKKVSRDAEILSIEKKQLEIVISNSLKKIQQLLQNQMQLKKTIHELKLQIEGKGGISSEYEMQIRNLKKTQKELREQIESLKSQIDKKNFNIKQLGQKNAFLQGQKSRRQQDYKSFYDSQRQIEDLLRKEKDRSMNAQLQVKRVQMQFQIYQKDKTAEINRLTRQLDLKLQAPQRQADTIRRLQEQLRIKDHKIESFVQQIQSLRGQIMRPVSPPPQSAQDSNKKILEELVRQMKTKSETDTKDNNEAIVRALIDKLGSRKDDTLKNELSSLRMQMQTFKKGSSVTQTNSQQIQLRSRIRQLQRVIDDQKREKRTLLQQIDHLKSQRDQLYSQCESHKRKIKQYKNTESKLLAEIQELGNFKIQLEQSKIENVQIKNRLQSILTGHSGSNGNVIHIRTETQNVNNLSYEEEVRMLRRKVDELTFALNKVTEQKSFELNMLNESQNRQVLRLNEDISRYRQLLKTNQQQLQTLTQRLKTQLQTKNAMIEDLTKRFEELDKKNRESIERSRVDYEALLKVQVTKHYNELQSMNQKILQLTKTNETFSSKGQYYAMIEREVTELRRLTKNQKRTNDTIDHLWEIKQTQYNNISEILASVNA